MVLLMFSLLVFSQAFSQGKYITDAQLAYNAGDYEMAKKSLDKATELIDQKLAAGEKIKEKDIHKLWKLKGQNYLMLASVEKDSLVKLNLLDLAKKADYTYFEKDPTKYYESEVKDAMSQLAILYQNTAITYYKEPTFSKSYDLFEECLKLKKHIGVDLQDLSVYHNVAYAAYYSKKYDRSIPYFNLLIDSSYNQLKSLTDYKRCLVRSFVETGDTATAIHKLQLFNPGDSIVDLLKEEVSLLLSTHKTKEALDKMKRISEKGSDDAVLYENMAKIYEQMNEFTLANSSYEQALKLNPSSVDSYYGLARILILDANKIKDPVLQRKKTTEALSYLETAEKINPKDQDVLRVLLQIYNQLNMPDKAKEVTGKLLELK